MLSLKKRYGKIFTNREEYAMKEQYLRTAMLFGEEAIVNLSNKRVAVFGIGGVGGHVVEVLARSGVGAIDLVDHDVVSVSNINRQLIATFDTVGKKKIEVMKERILSIQPECKVTTWDLFYLPESSDKLPFEQFDYIVDAIDTVTAKIDLVLKAQEYNVPIISSMGTGNKLDPTKLVVTDIHKTSVCPLAKVMRRELKKRDIKHLKVVYSTEEAMTPLEFASENQIEIAEEGTRRATPGSNAFVPATAGLLLGSEVVKDLISR